ncbi:Alcohol dehydrogenase superfamily, zinc-type [Metarhizium album ARSEF 1941]|uniref:Alcohol dehydrogenase superfamily, zinc-type n=1 Tax=Metarhizium album (strain ARSEF 1941) TaxID=1081103 RepID=A0A0B2WM99_METAS|nr:Alcohol dehydrogenase superfamily, zinc-type [Metarhizium album ARSEF 1941]KHN94769.1 Alcohol dehydrogenase superfamily, zinc-type [Metarhizium album ARSEF 1941]
MSLASYLPGFLGGKEERAGVAPPQMKRWTTGLDGIDKLEMEEGVDVPSPGDGEVLVRIHAVSLNQRDKEVCSGEGHKTKTAPAPAPAPASGRRQPQRLVPCSDMCGVVVRSRSRLLAPGARVASILLQTHLAGAVGEDDLDSALGLPLPGVLAEYRVFAAVALVPVPAYLSDEEASCLPVAGVTAWTGLNWMRPLGQHVGADAGPGGRRAGFVLVQGTGDVAVAALQAARAAGYKTIVTSSSDDRLRRAAEQLGADHTVNDKTHWEWQGPVMEATGGRGADLIFETGGARTIRKSFESVAFGGVINCIGDVSGEADGDPDKAPLLQRLNVSGLVLRRNVTLRGIVNGGKDRFEEMLGFYEEKKIRPVVGRVFAFAEAREALACLAAGEQFGKVVVKVCEG